MEKSNEQKIKQNQIITTILSFVFIGLLTATLTTSLTLAAFGRENGTINELIFGNIEMEDISQNFSIQNVSGQTLSTVTPGDDAKVNFTLENIGTADMLFRFKLVLTDTNTVDPVDTSIFAITIESAKVNGGAEDAEWVSFDFGDGNVWFVRRYALVGNLDTVTNDPPDYIKLNVSFGGEEMTNEYKDANIRVSLYVESTQRANNGIQQDVTLPGYDVTWAA